MTPETEILNDVLEQADRSAEGLKFALEMIGDFPRDVASFETMDMTRKLAATAMLKQVEQLEGSLASSFRVMLKMQGIALKGMFPMDIANRMAELDILDDAVAWVEVVKLRNELVHEYPFDVGSRFNRTAQAYAATPMLQDIARRARAYARKRGLLK